MYTQYNLFICVYYVIVLYRGWSVLLSTEIAALLVCVHKHCNPMIIVSMNVCCKPEWFQSQNDKFIFVWPFDSDERPQKRNQKEKEKTTERKKSTYELIALALNTHLYTRPQTTNTTSSNQAQQQQQHTKHVEKRQNRNWNEVVTNKRTNKQTPSQIDGFRTNKCFVSASAIYWPSEEEWIKHTHICYIYNCRTESRR